MPDTAAFGWPHLQTLCLFACN